MYIHSKIMVSAGSCCCGAGNLLYEDFEKPLGTALGTTRCRGYLYIPTRLCSVGLCLVWPMETMSARVHVRYEDRDSHNRPVGSWVARENLQ